MKITKAAESIRERVSERVNVYIDNQLKVKAKENISSEIIKNAINKALMGPVPGVLAGALEHPEKFCEKCGSCCIKNDLITLKKSDVSRISFYLGIDPNILIANHIKKVNGEKLSLKSPCPFVKNNLCSIYEARPDVCKSFPLQETKNGGVTLGIYSYCYFTVNVIAQSAIAYILLEIMPPDIRKQFEEMSKHITTKCNDDQKKQITFYSKWLRREREKGYDQ